jgi:hypothetical protein
MTRIDESVWALHIWRSPDGNEHPQWSGPGDPRSCRCGERHTLADATSRLICPGVAHYEGVRPCVLCGLGWRMSRAVQIDVPPLPGSEVVRAALLQAEPSITGAGVLSAPANHIYIDVVLPVPPRCIYCMTLEGPQNRVALAHHRAQAHPQEGH